MRIVGCDPSSEVAELLDRVPQLIVGFGEVLVERRIHVAGPFDRGAQPEREGEEPLLRAVVKVTLDATALGIGRADDAGA